MRARAGLVVAMLAAMLAVAGCGGGDDDSAAEESSLSKQEWIVKADEICAKGAREDAEEASRRFGEQPPSPAEHDRYLEEVAIPSLAAQVAGVKELGPPAGGEQEFAAIVAAADGGLAQIEADPTSLRTGAMDEATRLMNEFGSQICGSSE